MLGETVAVLTRDQTGVDGFNEPVYEWTSFEVGNCLVKPVATESIDVAERPDGVEPKYVIAFPKTYDGPALTHARVALVGRGMDASDHEAALRVSGSPDVTSPCPTAWNMLATVGAVHG